MINAARGSSLARRWNEHVDPRSGIKAAASPAYSG
jgi:hypothetical protein